MKIIYIIFFVLISNVCFSQTQDTCISKADIIKLGSKIHNQENALADLTMINAYQNNQLRIYERLHRRDSMLVMAKNQEIALYKNQVYNYKIKYAEVKKSTATRNFLGGVGAVLIAALAINIAVK